MKRDKKNMDDILKRHFKSPSNEEMETSKAGVLKRLREELGEEIREFNMGEAADQSPAAKAVRRFRETDFLVLRAVQILGGKGRISDIHSIVNELAMEPIGMDEIDSSMQRLHRKKQLNIRSVFASLPDAEQETANAEELGGIGNPAKEES